MSTGSFLVLLVAWGGRKRFRAISQPVVDASWVSLRSLPPKEAIVAVVLSDMVMGILKIRRRVERKNERKMERR